MITTAAAEPDSTTAYMRDLGRCAKAAASTLSRADTRQKNAALLAIADAIDQHRDDIQQANAIDLAEGQQKNLASALLDRLQLSVARIDGMVAGLRQIASLPDPIGTIEQLAQQPSGLQVGRMRVPLGVIGIIYEARPNVTADAAALCLKSGNAVILRGGSEAVHSNQAIGRQIHAGLASTGLPAAAVQLVSTTDRAAVGALITMTEYVDVIIPRGGERLTRRISAEAKVPVIKHFAGNCHVYIDAAADADKAVAIAVNAKTYRYGICGAMETLLLHCAIAPTLLPPIAAELRAHGVALRGCEATVAIVADAAHATEDDWLTEYLAPILAVRIVADLDHAIAHIATYCSGHTEAIVTEDLGAAQRFLREVDSASVMLNAPTCFADGFEYGLGAEIGISTDKLHVRGPVGLEGLTTRKFIIIGNGQTR